VYANVHTEGDTGRAVRQVPHDWLLRSTFGDKGDVADLLQFFAQMEMEEIRCIRLVAARFQETEPDDKSLTWDSSGERAWGQNVLTGAAAERCDVVMATELLIIHPQAFLEAGRAINLNPDNKTARARVFVKLYNNMQRTPQKAGFSLLNHDICPMLLADAAFQKFNEMSTIGPWIDKQGNLQWDYVIAAGFKGAHSVRNGNARKAQLVENSGYALDDKGKLCIQGYMDLGAARKSQLVESGDHTLNDKGKLCIQGYRDLGSSGGATNKTALVESGGHTLNDKG